MLTVVVTDANILINLFHADALALLGLISVADADRMKHILEQRRFVMTFSSFSEFV